MGRHLAEFGLGAGFFNPEPRKGAPQNCLETTVYYPLLTFVSVYDTSVDLSGPWPGEAMTVITLLPSFDDIFIVFVSSGSCQKMSRIFLSLKNEGTLCMELFGTIEAHIFKSLGKCRIV